MSRAEALEIITTANRSDQRQTQIQLNNLIADINTTAVGNVTTGEDNLMTYTLPADALSQAGHFVRILAWGTTANDADVKTLKGYIGDDAFLNQALTASIAGKWFVEAIIARTGSDTQDTFAILHEGTASLDAGKVAIENGTADQDEDAAIVIKFTGASDGEDTDDIVQEGMIVFLPATCISNSSGDILTTSQY